MSGSTFEVLEALRRAPAAMREAVPTIRRALAEGSLFAARQVSRPPMPAWMATRGFSSTATHITMPEPYPNRHFESSHPRDFTIPARQVVQPSVLVASENKVAATDSPQTLEELINQVTHQGQDINKLSEAVRDLIKADASFTKADEALIKTIEDLKETVQAFKRTLDPKSTDSPLKDLPFFKSWFLLKSITAKLPHRYAQTAKLILIVVALLIALEVLDQIEKLSGVPDKIEKLSKKTNCLMDAFALFFNFISEDIRQDPNFQFFLQQMDAMKAELADINNQSKNLTQTEQIDALKKHIETRLEANLPVDLTLRVFMKNPLQLISSEFFNLDKDVQQEQYKLLLTNYVQLTILHIITKKKGGLSDNNPLSLILDHKEHFALSNHLTQAIQETPDQVVLDGKALLQEHEDHLKELSRLLATIQTAQTPAADLKNSAADLQAQIADLQTRLQNMTVSIKQRVQDNEINAANKKEESPLDNAVQSVDMLTVYEKLFEAGESTRKLKLNDTQSTSEKTIKSSKGFWPFS